MLADALLDTVMFSGLSPQVLQKMTNMVVKLNLQNGQVLFQQGQDFHYFYFVEKGLIKLSRFSEEGDEKVIEVIKPGFYFAEALVFMSSSQYPVQAVALNETTVYAIEAKKYVSVLRQSPDACFQLLGMMSRRIHQLVQDIDKLSLHSTKSRLASYLLRCCEENQGSDCFCLDMPKSTLASRLNMKPETFSRALNFFHQQGCIDVEKREIRILDKDVLSRYAEDFQ